jgi:CRP-like cAMP-binding protein
MGSDEAADRDLLPMMEAQLARMEEHPETAARIVFQPFVANRLLAALTARDFALLAPHLRAEMRSQGDVIYRRDEPMERVQFIQQGVAVPVATFSGRSVALAAIGNEGFVGVPRLLASEDSPFNYTMWLEGDVLTLPAETLRAAVDASGSLRHALLCYVHAFGLQIAEGAVAGVLSSIEQRLARWLLLCDDRVDGHELEVTHDMIAAALGARRASITDATHRLEGLRAIRAGRKAILIRDRSILKRIAGEAYGSAEEQYDTCFPEAPEAAPVANPGRPVPPATRPAPVL